MANGFGRDILIQAPDPKAAAGFYVETLGFRIDSETSDLVELTGPAINLYIERGPVSGPILEVMVDDVAAARQKLEAEGCEIVKDEPDFPRLYVRDPAGLLYNLRRR